MCSKNACRQKFFYKLISHATCVFILNSDAEVSSIFQANGTTSKIFKAK